MSDPVAGGKLLAIPYRGADLGPELTSKLMQHMVDHPLWFAAGLDADEIRINVAHMLVSPEYWRWEIWNGGRFAGMILVSRVVPRCDAVFHFTLFPPAESGTTLFGARRLLWNFLGYAFDAFQLQRLSVEVPEHAAKLSKFLRQRLAFRYEGETDDVRLQKMRGVVRLDVPGIQKWVAGQGSRREKAHWNGTGYSDLILLRLLREEYQTLVSLGDMPKATADLPVEETHVARVQVSPV